MLNSRRGVVRRVARVVRLGENVILVDRGVVAKQSEK